MLSTQGRNRSWKNGRKGISMQRKQRVRISLHAEMHALLRVNKNEKVDMFVFSYKTDGELRMSRPCFHCLKSMMLWNIRFVYYSDSDGGICRERCCDMLNNDRTTISSGERRRLLSRM